ncbi:MAG: ATP-binding protein, partial [Gemmatimonadaceae bacterium]
LVCGPSGAGKSTFATGLIERLIDRSYQLCVIDPEGDYATLDQLVTIGSRLRAPHLDEVLERLGDSRASVAVNLLGIPFDDRPDFFSQLFPRLQAMRARTGGPAWILIDELHHLLPSPWGLAPFTLPQRLGETILITYRPSDVAPAIVAMMDIAVAVGPSPEATLAELAAVLGVRAPVVPGSRHGEAIVWPRSAGTEPFPAVIVPARSERLRHLRKYAEGNLGPKSFFFRGPGQKMNLRAQNLRSFCELASGIDDDTWLFHLRRGDYSAWLSEAIKDDELGSEVAGIERALHPGPFDSRRSVCDAIDKRYMISG